jgi:phytoene dehydrogenase-like protein
MADLAEKPYLIVGAGLAGLACATIFQDQNKPYLLIEADSQVGGRIQSDLHQNEFILDRGFQVLLNSYPDLKKFLNLKALNLQSFDSGAMIYQEHKNALIANPLRHPHLLMSSLRSEILSARDAIRVTKLVFAASQISDFKDLKNETTLDYLKSLEFSPHFIEYFWRPFMAGVMIDRSLSLDANYFLFLVRCFGLGSVSVPALGMGEIPKQMAAGLDPKKTMLGTRVSQFGTSHLVTEAGAKIEGKSVIRAHNPTMQGTRSVTTYHFTADHHPEWQKWLVLVPHHLGLNLNQLALMSAVSPSYSKNQRPLISATRIGIDASVSISTIEAEINLIARKNLRLTHLRTDLIEHALPPIASRAELSLTECGDQVSSPSIQGALQSGRILANTLIQR